MRYFLSLVFLLGLVLSGRAEENLLQQGNFATASAGAPPPAPWIVGKPKPNVNVVIEGLPGSSDGRLWAHFTDESGEDASMISQTFQGITSGRLTVSLHVLKYNAAVWFIFGRKTLAAREDMLFTFKITTKGGFLAATPEGKIANTGSSKTFSFAPGQTYDLYCDFKPADGGGLQIEVGQKDGGLIFSGTIPHAEPITAFSIRTHGEDAGSDFFVTDVTLTGTP